jgi:glycogen(starch) synthase
MRILHILDHSIPHHSGYAFRTLSILRQQRQLGWHTVQLTGPKHGEAESDDTDSGGWHFFRTKPSPGFLANLPLLRHLSLVRDLRRRLMEVVRLTRPDVLHAHSPALNALAALQVGRRLGIPVVYEIRAFWEDAAADHGTARPGSLRYRLSRALETYVVQRADAVTTICDGLRADIEARGVPAERITVIPNAVNLSHFDTARPRDNSLALQLGIGKGPTLGFVGSFYAYEGLDLLLSAMPQLIAAQPGLRLLLVGGGPQEALLKQRASQLAIDSQVIFTGRVPHDDVASYYSVIDVLVYPRLAMRLTDLVTPLKPLEAMAQGRLVLASDVGGHRELIQDGHTGLLFKAGDKDDLVGTALTLLRSPQRWPALKAAARSYVETERNWTASVARYAPVYAAMQPGFGQR